eukprot:6491117-Amphidinium_carterae.2
MPPRGKYTNRLQPIAEDGPYTIVAVVSHSRARWEGDFEARAANVGKQILRKHLEEHGLLYEELSNPSVTSWFIEGLVVMPAWRVVQAQGTAFAAIDVEAIDSRQVTHNLLLQQCKDGLRAAIEYPVLSAAYFALPLELPASVTGEFENYAAPLEKPSIVGPMWAAMQGADITLVGEAGRTKTHSVQSLWTQWSQQYCLGPVSPTSCLAGWRAWRPVAALMVRLAWFGDAVAIQQRNTGRFAVRLRTEAPPTKLLRQYLDWKALPPKAEEFPLVAMEALRTQKELVVPAVVLSNASQPVATKGPIKQWPARHLLNAVLATENDKQLGEFSTSLKRKLEFMFDEAQGAELWQRLTENGLSVPDRGSIARGRIQLDLACTAHERDRNRARRLTWRQLNFDSSPKGGMEILGIKECIMEEGDASQPLHQLWPLVSLGFGFASTADKIAALVHAIQLQTGPSLLEMKHLLESVYVILTDGGVELNVVNAPDCAEAILNGNAEDYDPSSAGYLFPHALQVLDMNHLWDWVLKTSCERLSFYSDFEVMSKSLCKMLNTRSYVDALAENLQADGLIDGSAADDIKTLRAFTANFAKWRFGTLHSVCKHLLRVQYSLKRAWRAGRPLRFKECL